MLRVPGRHTRPPLSISVRRHPLTKTQNFTPFSWPQPLPIAHSIIRTTPVHPLRCLCITPPSGPKHHMLSDHVRGKGTMTWVFYWSLPTVSLSCVPIWAQNYHQWDVHVDFPPVPLAWFWVPWFVLLSCEVNCWKYSLRYVADAKYLSYHISCFIVVVFVFHDYFTRAHEIDLVLRHSLYALLLPFI